jgi:hypothetical protein
MRPIKVRQIGTVGLLETTMDSLANTEASLTPRLPPRSWWLLYVAIGIAAALSLLILWAHYHDNPSVMPLQNQGNITFMNEEIHVVIDCTCPRVLIEGQPRSLSFQIRAKRVRPTPPLLAAPVDPIDVWVNGGSAAVDPGAIFLGEALDLSQGDELTQRVTFSVTPKDAALSAITFSFLMRGKTPFGSIVWGIESEADAWTILEPYAYTGAVFTSIIAIFLLIDRQLRVVNERAERRLHEATIQADANPEKARFAWDLARVKLEAYFDRNLVQVNLVFWLAVVVMAVGFCFVLAGVVLSYRQHTTTPTAVVAAVSGIITQFIGATFMVIYRSTMVQANEFMVVLERINNAGMAVQVLDALPEGTDLKNSTRANIALLLLGGEKPSPAATPLVSRSRKV